MHFGRGNVAKTTLLRPWTERGPRKRVDQRTRAFLWASARGACANCRLPLPPQAYHVDHVVPWAVGGTNAVRNLQVLCPNCHAVKTACEQGKVLRVQRLRKRLRLPSERVCWECERITSAFFSHDHC